MDNFDIGETVICWRNVKDENGDYKDPATSMTITIVSKKDNNNLGPLDMVKDETGKYHYDWQTVNCIDGAYVVVYTATDGENITIEKVGVQLG